MDGRACLRFGQPGPPSSAGYYYRDRPGGGRTDPHRIWRSRLAMIVYKITLAEYADALSVSGSAARWNSKDVKVIYTAGSRSLACLEKVVHRSSRGMQGIFRTLVIEIPDNLKIIVVDKGSLIPHWQSFSNMPHTQQFGD